MHEGLLVTADGAVFRGRSVGAAGIATGEIVFNTAMSGYQEIVTDPSYAGQIIAFTAPHIGNYGTTEHDEQSAKVHAQAVVTRSMSRSASSWRSTLPFNDYLVDRNVVALSDIDTRRLTRHVRDRGAMSVAVGAQCDESELRDRAEATPSLEGLDLASTVSTPFMYRSEGIGSTLGHVVAYDFGIKRDIVRSLNARGLDVTVVPGSTTASAALALAPDGIFLSNGPGDPEPVTGAVEAISELLGTKPMFGICLGHQLLSLALGAKTFKLPFGHHGGNHPVRRLADGRVEITSQNHGFAVELGDENLSHGSDSGDFAYLGRLPGHLESPFGRVTVSHRNLNDGTIEGIRCDNINACSVQYHPEAAPGPNDAAQLFDRFAEAVRSSNA